MENPVLQAALEYRRRGWSVIPMRMAEKRPAKRWRRYQKQLASDSTVRRWFKNDELGVAVVFGSVSGGLASRDFDTMEAYDQWAAEHPDLARELPTVATHRGRHVYFRVTTEDARGVRQALGKNPDATGALHLGDGELRLGVGCYSVLPPSRHPRGSQYGWLVPLPVGDLPLVDPLEAGLVDRQTCDRVDRVLQSRTEAVESGEGVKGAAVKSDGLLANTDLALDEVTLDDQVDRAIAGALPAGPGQRHRKIFEFARALKAIPPLAGCQACDCRAQVEAWHRRARPFIRTKAFEETWIDFLQCWDNVRYPKGEEPMAQVFDRACANIPEAAEVYDQSEVQRLVSLCRELQRSAGNNPFYLACRKAGELLGVGRDKAHRWLFLLMQDRLLEEVCKGDFKTGRASRYRYLGGVD